MADNNKRAGTNFLIQGSILAVASVIVRLIGIVYRIPLTNILGDGGNSAYSNAYAIYSLIWMIASFGIPTAVSKMVAERLGANQGRNSKRVFYTALGFATLVGGLAFCVLFFGAGFFANVVYGRPEIRYALMVLAPTVWVSAFLGAFRGYFQGHGDMVPTAISQIFEQIVNAVISLVGAWYLWNMGRRIDLLHEGTQMEDALGAAGGTIGTLAGAVTGVLVCIVIYKLYFSKMMEDDGLSQNEDYTYLFRTLILMILPITLNSAIYNISSVLDASIYSNFAKFAGIPNEIYKINWNAYEGKYHLLTHVPLAFATALASSAVPDLSRSLRTAKPSVINRKINMAIRFALLVAIPSAVGLAVLGKPIMQLLFASTPASNELASRLLIFGGITVILYSFSTLTNGILQGIGKVSTPARNAAISLAGHIVILVVFLFVLPFDIYGVVVSDIIFGLMMNIMNYVSIYRAIRFKMDIATIFLRPLGASAIMGGAAYGCYRLLMMATHRNSISCLASIAAAVIVYAMCLLVTGSITEEDLKSFPKGAALTRLAKKTHLLRSGKSSK